MDRELSESIKRIRLNKRLLQITTFCILFVVLIIFIRQLITPTINFNNFQTATTEIGDVLATVSAVGTILPEFEETRTSPIPSRIINIYQNIGNEVHKGDTIIMLDINSQTISLEKLKEELAIKKNNVTKLKLLLEKSIIDLKTQYKIKQLYVGSMEAELKEEKYLNTIGGGTKEKIEKAALNLKIAKLELEQINQTITNKKNAMLAELKGVNYEINIQQKNVNELQNKINRATIKADKKGVITWINNQIGKTVSEGEEMVKIANLQSFEVEGSISDIHSEKLINSSKVFVQINEQTKIKGEVISISPAIEANVIRFKIRLAQKNHALLRPNMKVDVFLITSFRKNVVRIKNGQFYKGGIQQKIFVVENNKLIQKEVSFGESNINYIEIASGLSENQKIVISNMQDYERFKELTIKN